jgi:hypothetical protein
MVGEVQLGGVVENEYQRLLGDSLACALPVRLQESVVGSGVLIAEAIEATQIVPVEDLGEGFFRVGGDVSSGLDESSGASAISQVGVGEVVFGPLVSIGKNFHDSLLGRKCLGGSP